MVPSGADVAVARGRGAPDFEVAAREERKRQATQSLCISMFHSVCQHVITVQSEPRLVQELCGGDAAAAARALANTSGLIGALGLMVNRAGGKISDSVGRKLFFMIGPITNIVTQILVATCSNNRLLVLVCRVIKGIMTTFSSAVMASTALADILNRQELDVAMSQIGALLGVGIMATTMAEGVILARTNNNVRIPYLVGAGLGVSQLLFNTFCLQETLDVAKRKALDFQELLWSLNPFTFVQIYTRGSRALQKMVTVTTLQMSIEGKNVSDLAQLWARNDLNWGSEEIGNFITTYGLLCLLAGMSVTPKLLQSLSVFRFTSVTNLTNLVGFVMRGAAAKGWLFYLAVVPMLPGVNGASATALKALANSHAEASGFSQDEFATWTNNLRALVSALACVAFGNYYAWAKGRGLPAGTTFALAGVVGGLLPELILRTLKDADLRPPGGTMRASINGRRPH